MIFKLLILIFIIILAFVLNIIRIFLYGSKPEKIEKSIVFNKGIYYIKEAGLKCKFVATNLNSKEQDLIIYLHGVGMTELEWVEENGFGKIYFDILNEDSKLKKITAVSISLGPAFFFIDGAPSPFNADLEEIFLNKIIPHFQKLLNKNGKVYLIGHSMGGYNALSMSLRHPERFPLVFAISPFVAPISPFEEEFKLKGIELRMPKFQIKIFRRMLKRAFKNEEKWEEYSPYFLVKAGKINNPPFIVLSRATMELPGFDEAIDKFVELLENKKINHFNCINEGHHKSVCHKAFKEFLNRISNGDYE
jgi:pimeloyl-ACP methyl ester carboxylesterase